MQRGLKDIMKQQLMSGEMLSSQCKEDWKSCCCRPSSSMPISVSMQRGLKVCDGGMSPASKSLLSQCKEDWKWFWLFVPRPKYKVVSMQRGLKASGLSSIIHFPISTVSMQRGLKVNVGNYDVYISPDQVSMQRGLKVIASSGSAALNSLRLNAKRIESSTSPPVPALGRLHGSQCKEDWKLNPDVLALHPFSASQCKEDWKVNDLERTASAEEAVSMQRGLKVWAYYFGYSPAQYCLNAKRIERFINCLRAEELSKLRLNAKRIESSVSPSPLCLIPFCLNAKRIERLYGTARAEGIDQSLNAKRIES